MSMKTNEARTMTDELFSAPDVRKEGPSKMQMSQKCKRGNHEYTKCHGTICAVCDLPRKGTPARHLYNFWRHVDKNGPIPARRQDLGCCWVWTGSVKHDGYGQADLVWPSRTPHRISFYLSNGYWPKEPMEVDHLCRNRLCVRPTHLQEVTNFENHQRRRVEACNRGHEYTPENTYVVPGSKNKRYCRICIKLRSDMATAKRRGLSS